MSNSVGSLLRESYSLNILKRQPPRVMHCKVLFIELAFPTLFGESVPSFQ